MEKISPKIKIVFENFLEINIVKMSYKTFPAPLPTSLSLSF